MNIAEEDYKVGIGIEERIGGLYVGIVCMILVGWCFATGLYATLYRLVIPFCSYNTLHREEVGRKFSVSLRSGGDRITISDLPVLRDRIS
ncbi:MAG: hypothetical protein U9N43_00970 [Euryarchaeota archaeon]|nr:hypothetical protein [Euryarchaeota archaeon]